MTRQELLARKAKANNDNTLLTIQDNLRITGYQLFEGIEAREKAVEMTIEQTQKARNRKFEAPLTGAELYVAIQRQRRGCPLSSFKRFG